MVPTMQAVGYLSPLLLKKKLNCLLGPCSRLWLLIDSSPGLSSSSQATSHGIEEVSDATLSSPVLTSVSFVFPFPVFDPSKHQQHAVLTCSNLIYIADPSSSCSDQRSPIREKSGTVIHQLKLVIYLSCSCCTKPIQCQQSLQSYFSTVELVTWLPHT